MYRKEHTNSMQEQVLHREITVLDMVNPCI